MKLLRLSLRNVFRNKRRTAITTAVVGIGVSMLLLSLAYVGYIKWGYGESIIHSTTGHFQIFNKEFHKKDERRILKFGIKDWKEICKKLKSLDEVEVCLPRVGFMGLASTGEKSVAVIVNAIQPQKEVELGSGFIDSKPLEALSKERYSIGLGKALVKSLGVKKGDYVTLFTTTSEGALNAMDFKVTSVFSALSEELEKRLAMINLEDAFELLGTKKVRSIAVGLYNTEDLPVVMRKLPSLLPPSVSAKVWKEIAKDYLKVMNFFFGFIGFLTIVIMIIVWFSAMNTVMMSVLERTSEFAAIKAMGGKNSLLMRMLTLEGIWLGIIGVAAGFVLELIFSWLINHASIMLPPPPNSTHGYLLRVKNSPDIFIWVGIATVLIVALSSFLPSIRILRLKIAEGLRK